MSKGTETRKRIVHQAAIMFNTRGYEGGCLLDLMAATNLEKGGLYRHFASKEEIAAEAFRHAWQEVTNARSRNLSGIASPRQKLVRMIANFVEIRSPIPGGCPLMNTAADADDGNLTLRELAREALDAWKRRLMDVIEAGIRAGEFAHSLDKERLANVIIATLEGALMITRIEHSRQALHDAQAYLESHIAGL